ncbi:MAG: hypothetical protein IT181_19745 [Acidobacteria bacterium]|nr:hypothetical protein [Acidobacteriota bacterium]
MPDRARWERTGFALLLVLIAVPLATAAQQALVLAAGALLRTGTGAVEQWLLPHLPVDPVYAGAALRIVGGVEPLGLAVAGPLGEALHWLAPAIFGSPDRVAPGAIISALLGPGATVAARALSMLLATGALVWGLLHVGRWQHTAGRQAAVRALHVWLLLGLVHETTLDVREIEATGLPFALAALAPVEADGQRALATRSLDALPTPLVEGMTALLAVLACVGIAWALYLVATVALRVARRQGRRAVAARWRAFRAMRPGVARGAAVQGAALAALFALAVLGPVDIGAAGRPSSVPAAAVLPTTRAQAHDFDGRTYDQTDDVVPVAHEGALSSQQPHPAAAPGTGSSTDAHHAAAEPSPTTMAAAPSSPPTAGSAPPTSVATATAGPPTAAAPSPGPNKLPVAARGSVVAVSGGNYQYTFTVNGTPTVIQGMGYNPWYADRAPDARRALYARDFGAMRDIGVNTIEGWFQEQFDAVTLDEAHRLGIGVIMPFELNHDYDYGDPTIRAKFRQQITEWVLRYRAHPAVLMWGPGNEVMHRLIFPSAVQGQSDPARQKRADDFAAFYVEIVDLIHELDPNHPVVYRDAEDLYLARMRAALLRDGKPRPWFVYGTNVYTQRLAEVIENWPRQGLDAPLLVSEFSPGGVGMAERPRMLGWYWSTIRAHPERVIGGVVYTWATRGPEDLDRVFGLTDEEGRPIDGSLATLRRLFQADSVSRRGGS